MDFMPFMLFRPGRRPRPKPADPPTGADLGPLCAHCGQPSDTIGWDAERPGFCIECVREARFLADGPAYVDNMRRILTGHIPARDIDLELGAAPTSEGS